MENVKIYLSGAMGGLTIEEQLKWRTKFKNALKYGDYDITKEPIIHSPPEYYPFIEDINESERTSEREVMEFDLYQVRTTDIVVVNFTNPSSIGTAMELAVAREYHKPIIGLNADDKVLHSWLTESCTRICSTMQELVDHVVRFYLN